MFRSGYVQVRPYRKRARAILQCIAVKLANWQADLQAKGVPRLNDRQAFPPLSCLLAAVTTLDFLCPVRFNSDRTAHIPRDKPMKKLLLAILLIASPAWAQTKLVPKSTTARVDNCAPIGRTADGKLVYSMKCDNLPAPPPPPQAEAAPPSPPAEPEARRSGIFGWSFERKRPDE